MGLILAVILPDLGRQRAQIRGIAREPDVRAGELKHSRGRQRLLRIIPNPPADLEFVVDELALHREVDAPGREHKPPRGIAKRDRRSAGGRRLAAEQLAGQRNQLEVVGHHLQPIVVLAAVVEPRDVRGALETVRIPPASDLLRKHALGRIVEVQVLQSRRNGKIGQVHGAAHARADGLRLRPAAQIERESRRSPRQGHELPVHGHRVHPFAPAAAHQPVLDHARPEQHRRQARNALASLGAGRARFRAATGPSSTFAWPGPRTGRRAAPSPAPVCPRSGRAAAPAGWDARSPPAPRTAASRAGSGRPHPPSPPPAADPRIATAVPSGYGPGRQSAPTDIFRHRPARAGSVTNQ